MGFFDKFAGLVKEPVKVAAGIGQNVTKVAVTAAEVKAKFDLIGADLDGNGKTQVEDIKAQGAKISHRAFGDAALKVAPAGETEEQKAAREKLLAEEKTTVKLIAKTKKEWSEEIKYYEVEGKVLFALVGGFTKALIAGPAAVPQVGNEVA